MGNKFLTYNSNKNYHGIIGKSTFRETSFSQLNLLHTNFQIAREFVGKNRLTLSKLRPKNQAKKICDRSERSLSKNILSLRFNKLKSNHKLVLKRRDEKERRF